MKNIFYFGLESVNSRYTQQLCQEWIPSTFKKHSNVKLIDVFGQSTSKEIKVGSVLDATGRGIFSLSQCGLFLTMIKEGMVENGDAIYLQDFWTPGFDSILYALDLYKIKVNIYAMIHAQSVDEYDFTYSMRSWMRNYELGLDSMLTASFVASTVHKEQLRAAGFVSDIHVVSLPISSEIVLKSNPKKELHLKHKSVIYTSRLDKEKNPYFMLETAKVFLKENPNYTWLVTTSGKEFKSTLNGFLDDLFEFAYKEPRFILRSGISKDEYYEKLNRSEIQFNSSLQDYVSWTAIEASLYGCKLVYPDFRSFKESIDSSYMYVPFNKNSALKSLKKATKSGFDYMVCPDLVRLSDLGRELEVWIMCNDYKGGELNIWHEKELIESLIKY